MHGTAQYVHTSGLSVAYGEYCAEYLIRYCMAGTAEYEVQYTAIATEELPAQYTGCHAHGSEM